MIRKTPKIGQPFIASHTAKLSDYDLILAGYDARLVYPDLLLLSAHRGEYGYVTKDTNALAIILHFTPEIVENAVTALARIGKLEDGGDRWVLTEWELTQADLGGSTTRSESAKVAQLKRRHDEGKHAASAHPECTLCQQGIPSMSQPVQEAEEPHEDQQPQWGTAPETVGGAPVASKRTMKNALADFRAALDADIPQAASPFEGYIAALGAADQFAEILADLSENPRGALRNEVLAHALRNLVDEKISYSGINRANKEAKLLGADGHNWWIDAIIRRGGQPYEDEKHCLNDLTTVARTERSKRVAA